MALSAKHNEVDFHIGDTVRVHQKIQEGDSPRGEAGKSRTQIFQGTVIAIRGERDNKMFTVRRLGVTGVGIERIFPLALPLIEKVEVAAIGHVKRAKLYYLRQKPPSEIAALTVKKQSKSKSKSKMKSKSRSKSKIKTKTKSFK